MLVTGKRKDVEELVQNLYLIDDYELNEKNEVIANCWVQLSDSSLRDIKVQFEYAGAFYIDNNPITTLEGCPYRVESNFDCSRTKITSLKFMPKYIGGSFICKRCFDIPIEDYKYALLSTIMGRIVIADGVLPHDSNLQIAEKLEQILTIDRVNGVMPSERIPGKIKELKELK